MQRQMEELFDELFPINRSLTGDGNRETLKVLSKCIDINFLEVPSGTDCFDWKVPPEWNIREAWIKDKEGNKIVDFSNLNLHILGYSEPFHGKMNLEELKKHIYTLPDQPDLVPYVTSYYKRRWAFCITHNQLMELKEQEYEVYIESSLNEAGSMTIGEAFIKGNTDDEVLFSTYLCHPSMANNELSGPLVTTMIYNELKKKKNLRYSYRFVFVPETIGSIAYLKLNGEHFINKLKAGFVVTCIGDNGNFTYKKSKRGNSLTDRAVELVLNQTEQFYTIHDFFPTGSDERQYCSPGFNLPVGSLMRTMYGKYKEYHTSGDNKSFISFEKMQKSVEKYIDVIEVVEKNFTYINKMPFCEPQLGKRGLYPTISTLDTAKEVSSMMWLLSLADGTMDLIDISKRSDMSFKILADIADRLIEKDLLEIK